MNIADLIARHAAAAPRRPALAGGRERLTTEALDLMVRRLAARLRAAGVAPGDLVALRLRDTPVHIVALLAVARIGGVALPLDWRAAAPEIARIAARFQPKLMLVDDAKRPPDGTPALAVADLAATEPDTAPPASLEGAPLVYGLTSGTTGLPKGIVTTHEEMFGRFVAFTLGRIIDRDDRFLVPLPLVFDAGRAISLSLLTLGAEVRLFPSLFGPADLVAAANAGATAVIVTPKTSRALLAAAPDGARLMPRLRAYVSTAGKLQPEERAALRRRVAPHVIDYYGTTGAGPVAIIADAAEDVSPTAAGRPTAGIEVEVVDDAGAPVPAGAMGRIRLRGPGVTRSFADGAATPAGDETLAGGWYYPGDIGSLAADGILHLTGRTADMIKRGGLMVHAQEVEYVLSLVDAVVEAAVVGVPAGANGSGGDGAGAYDEEVVAFVVIGAPVEPSALIGHCVQNLAGYKVPRHIEIVASLPRNTTGKVVKAELRQRFAGRVG